MKRMSSVLAAIALLGAQAYGAEALGKIEPAKDLMGRAVKNSQGKIGDIKGFVVDLESGRILYSVVSVDGKQIADFEIAGDFLVRNRFAVTAHFRDRSSGVYLATIPPRSFKRMNAAGK